MPNGHTTLVYDPKTGKWVSTPILKEYQAKPKTKREREPFAELARNEFLEFLDNLLNYAIKM